MKYINQDKHNEVIMAFLKWINSQTDRFILKGGTALYQCYDLDRFSEDIDFDSEKGNITNLVKNFCKQHHYSFNEKKDTRYGQRFLIDYGIPEQLLKIETSHRNKEISKNTITIINNIRTYTLDRLLIGKANAFNQRDRIRDLYDLCFFVVTQFDKLHEETKQEIKRVLSNKTINQYEIVIKNQNDDLVAKRELMELVIKADDIIRNYKDNS